MQKHQFASGDLLQCMHPSTKEELTRSRKKNDSNFTVVDTVDSMVTYSKTLSNKIISSESKPI